MNLKNEINFDTLLSPHIVLSENPCSQSEKIVYRRVLVMAMSLDSLSQLYDIHYTCGSLPESKDRAFFITSDDMKK